MDIENVTEVKSKRFAIRIMKLVQYLMGQKRPLFIINQIGRSGTSIGANVVEAEHAISKKEFLQKMYIAYKECCETLYWLDLLAESHYITPAAHDSLLQDCQEVQRLLASITKTVAAQLKKDKFAALSDLCAAPPLLTPHS